MATGTSVLCAQYWGKGDKKTVEKILGLASDEADIAVWLTYPSITVSAMFTNVQSNFES